VTYDFLLVLHTYVAKFLRYSESFAEDCEFVYNLLTLPRRSEFLLGRSHRRTRDDQKLSA